MGGGGKGGAFRFHSVRGGAPFPPFSLALRESPPLPLQLRLPQEVGEVPDDLGKVVAEMKEVHEAPTHTALLREAYGLERYWENRNNPPGLEAVNVDEVARSALQEAWRKAEATYEIGYAMGQTIGPSLGENPRVEEFQAALRQTPVSHSGLAGYIAGVAESNPEAAQALAQAVPQEALARRETLEAWALGEMLERRMPEMSLGQREALAALSERLPDLYAEEVQRAISAHQPERGRGEMEIGG